MSILVDPIEEIIEFAIEEQVRDLAKDARITAEGWAEGAQWPDEPTDEDRQGCEVYIYGDLWGVNDCCYPDFYRGSHLPDWGVHVLTVLNSTDGEVADKIAEQLVVMYKNLARV